MFFRKDRLIIIILFILYANLCLIIDSKAVKIVTKPAMPDHTFKYSKITILFKPPYIENNAINNGSKNIRKIKFYNVNTQEKLNIVFWKDGTYLKDSMIKINKFLRDRRNGKITNMDPELIMRIEILASKVGYEGYVNIISAFRSEKTNTRMKIDGRDVAVKSMHSAGKAADISMNEIPLETLYQAALSLDAGGVGYYPKNGFIHIDTGLHRKW